MATEETKSFANKPAETGIDKMTEQLMERIKTAIKKKLGAGDDPDAADVFLKPLAEGFAKWIKNDLVFNGVPFPGAVSDEDKFGDLQSSMTTVYARPSSMIPVDKDGLAKTVFDNDGAI